MSYPSLRFHKSAGDTVLAATYSFSTVSAGATSSGDRLLLWNLSGSTGSVATSVVLRVMDAGGTSQTGDLQSEGWVGLRHGTSGSYTVMSSGASLEVGYISANASEIIDHYVGIPADETDPTARTFVYRADYSFT